MFKEHFRVDENGNLYVGGVKASDLAERFGTPLFVMDEVRIRNNYRRFYNAFATRWERVLIAYAYKANSNLAVCKVLHEEGAGAEVVSMCELKAALGLGVPAEKIVFNGNNKSEREIELAARKGVLINVDSLEELELINELSTGLGRKVRIGIRVNPNIEVPTHPYIATGLRESKFGLDMESGEALEGFSKAMGYKNLEVVGIHCHVGSQILDTAPFEEEAKRVMDFVGKLKEELRLQLEFVDLGGGLGVPRKPGERGASPEEVASRVIPVLRESVRERGVKPFTLILEPGRYLVGDAGVLLLRVGCFKPRDRTPSWVCVDGGINILIRPALLGTYYHMEVANRMKSEHTELVNIAGPLCQSGDVIGRERKIPKVRRGDLIAVFDAGAYTLVMSSQYNSQPRPAVVMVREGEAEVVRYREDCEDVLRYERIPSWLR